MATVQDLHDALSDIEVRTQELGQAVLAVSSAVQNLIRDQTSLRDILRLLERNWE